MTTQEWRALVRKLRKRFPVDSPVVVRRCRRKRNLGMTTYDGLAFRVYIDNSQSATGQIDCLIHEWAHVCAIELAFTHDGHWGAYYSAIYNSWLRDFDDEKPTY